MAWPVGGINFFSYFIIINYGFGTYFSCCFKRPSTLVISAKKDYFSSFIFSLRAVIYYLSSFAAAKSLGSSVSLSWLEIWVLLADSLNLYISFLAYSSSILVDSSNLCKAIKLSFSSVSCTKCNSSGSCSTFSLCLTKFVRWILRLAYYNSFLSSLIYLLKD